MKSCPKCGHSLQRDLDADVDYVAEGGDEPAFGDDDELAVMDEALGELEDELEGSAVEKLKGPSVQIEVRTAKAGKKRRPGDDDEDV